jgi:hypothetical protein
MQTRPSAEGDDQHERMPEVQALHEALQATATGSPDASRALFELLSDSELWILAVPPWPAGDRLRQVIASDGPTLELTFRSGLTKAGEKFMPTATTTRRLLRSGWAQPGDTTVRAPFRLLARMARDAGMNSLVINPGLEPMFLVSRPTVLSFADGLVPNPKSPDREASANRGQIGPIETIEDGLIPTRLVDAATQAVRSEPTVLAASLIVSSINKARLFVILASAPDEIDQRGLTARLMGHITATTPPEEYLTVEYVSQTDPRLTDLARAAVLLRRQI